MIYLIGNAPESPKYLVRPCKKIFGGHPSMLDFAEFLCWADGQYYIQFDVETTVTKWWCDKKLITLQFGDIDGQDQWVIQWSALSPLQKKLMKEMLENKTRWVWLIHNAMFELVVLLFHDIRLRNVYCTMLAEMILTCGLETKEEELEDDETDEAGGFYSLTEVCYRYLGVRLNKYYQMSFGDDILTEGKVLYAAMDVTKLGFIYRMQVQHLSGEDLEFVAAEEMEAVLGYAEMTFRGMPVDQEKWLEQLDLAYPVQVQAKEQLNKELIDRDGPFLKKALQMGFYRDKDEWVMKWTNPKKKAMLIERFFPFLVGKTSNAVLQKMIGDHHKGKINIPQEALDWVVSLAELEYNKIQNACIETDRDWLIEHGFILPAGAITINWDSWQQVLPIFQCYKKNLKSTSKRDMGMFYHPIGTRFKEYKDAKKLTTTYGVKFLEEHMEPDSVVRTSFNQIMSTGRVSSRRPNMQQIPVREPIGPRYRNCFISHDPSWSYVSSDLMSAELCIIAYMSGEKVWLEALKKRQDLHSVCAEIIFGKEWKTGADEGCAYYKPDYWSEKLQSWRSEVEGYNELIGYPDWIKEPRHAKCKCKKHKVTREPTKTIDFGAAYGMSKYKLAGDMRWELPRAEGVLKDYFRTFSGISGMLNYMAMYGVTYGYIQTIAPFFRKRWFPKWKDNKAGIEAHLKDIKYDPDLGAIERASKNQPIQGTQADIIKLSLIMLYWEIHDGEQELSDRVHLVCQVHDQNDTRVRNDYIDTWMPVMDRIMCEASAFVIPNGLLRADTTTFPVWTK